MSEATSRREPEEPDGSDDVRVTCFACGDLRPIGEFREEDLDGGEPWCAGCREIAEELARDEEDAGR